MKQVVAKLSFQKCNSFYMGAPSCEGMEVKNWGSLQFHSNFQVKNKNFFVFFLFNFTHFWRLIKERYITWQSQKMRRIAVIHVFAAVESHFLGLP